MRRNDRQGDRAGRHSGGDDLGHLQLRPHHRGEPRDPRRAHRARLRRSHLGPEKDYAYGMRIVRTALAGADRRRARARRCSIRWRPARARRPAMRLEMGTFPVHGHHLRRDDALRRRPARGGPRGACWRRCAQDPRIATAELEIARPGESVRIWPVRDVIEPRLKVEGPGRLLSRHLRARHRHGGRGAHASPRRHGRGRGVERQLARRRRGLRRDVPRHVRALGRDVSLSEAHQPVPGRRARSGAGRGGQERRRAQGRADGGRPARRGRARAHPARARGLRADAGRSGAAAAWSTSGACTRPRPCRARPRRSARPPTA